VSAVPAIRAAGLRKAYDGIVADDAPPAGVLTTP